MSDTTASLRRKIGKAGDLQFVVRTMKAVAASSIGQYEQSVRALADYYRTVEPGFGACFREASRRPWLPERGGRQCRCDGAVVFGSDQGLVGRFNDVVADQRSRRWPLCRRGPWSGPSASAFMRAWRTRDCRWWDSSPCRTPSRPSPRSSGRSSWRARHAAAG